MGRVTVAGIEAANAGLPAGLLLATAAGYHDSRGCGDLVRPVPSHPKVTGGSGCVVRRSQGFPQTGKKSENLPAEVRASLVFPPASPVVCGPVRKPLASGSISARIAGGL
jgi:hypothetical protein